MKNPCLEARALELEESASEDPSNDSQRKGRVSSAISRG